MQKKGFMDQQRRTSKVAQTSARNLKTQIKVQWNPSCEAISFAPEMWPFMRGGLSLGIEINTFNV